MKFAIAATRTSMATTTANSNSISGFSCKTSNSASNDQELEQKSDCHNFKSVGTSAGRCVGKQARHKTMKKQTTVRVRVEVSDCGMVWVQVPLRCGMNVEVGMGTHGCMHMSKKKCAKFGLDLGDAAFSSRLTLSPN